MGFLKKCNTNYKTTQTHFDEEEEEEEEEEEDGGIEGVSFDWRG